MGHRLHQPECVGGLAEYMGLTTADLVVGQEARVLSEEKTESEALLRGKGWKATIEPCLCTELDGRSAGVMVAVRKHIGMRLSISEGTAPADLKHRCTFGFVSAIIRGGFHLGSIYLVSSIGVKAKRNMNILDAVATTLKTLSGRWIIGGDFNCTPEQLEATGWLRMVGGVIVATKVPTASTERLTSSLCRRP